MADTTKKASVQIVNEEQENMAVTEVETTEEENKTLIRMNEDDFIQGLISAADYAKDDTQRIEIARNGKVLFAFEIRPLSEEEYNKCKKKHTKYVRNKQFGMKLPEETNTVKFRDALIYTATVEADREKLWDNKKVWESLRAKEGPEAIIPLVPGRRNRALELYKEVGDILGVQANANGNIIGEATPFSGGARTVSAHANGGYVNDALDIIGAPHKSYEVETPMESVIKNITPYSIGQSSIGSTATEMFAYSSISDFLSLNDNLLAEAIRNGAAGYNGFTEGTESDSDTADEPLSSSSTVETGKTNINLNIQMSPQFNISDSGNGKMDEASIMAIIRKNMKSMADELGGEIADRLEQVFSNMPVVKEG